MTDILEVCIGLILLYLVLSLACTTVNELIATALKLRATQLSKAVTQLIDNEDVRKAFYNHGLIAGAKLSSRGGEPEKGSETTARAKPKDTHHPSYFDGRTFAMALLASVDPGNANPDFGLAAIKGHIQGLPDSQIRDVLLANLATANNDLLAMRDNVAAWFDSAMERLSGAYTRRMKWISLIVGILLAAAFNADSVDVGRKIWNDQVLRGQVITAANDALKTAPAAVSDKCKQDAQGKELAPEVALNCQVSLLVNQTDQLRVFPIGWSPAAISDLQKSDPLSLLLKLLGILWTGLALSLGAPFWFDLLQRFVNVRGAGGKPDLTKKPGLPKPAGAAA